jgi:hypothetical protein
MQPANGRRLHIYDLPPRSADTKRLEDFGSLATNSPVLRITQGELKD